jgi:hypothetical protein
MDDVVTIEYRGMSGELEVGSTVTVESCHAGVLRLRRTAATINVDKPKPSTRSRKEPTDAS